LSPTWNRISDTKMTAFLHPIFDRNFRRYLPSRLEHSALFDGFSSFYLFLVLF
jgi:hypothetical protein